MINAHQSIHCWGWRPVECTDVYFVLIALVFSYLPQFMMHYHVTWIYVIIFLVYGNFYLCQCWIWSKSHNYQLFYGGGHLKCTSFCSLISYWAPESSLGKVKELLHMNIDWISSKQNPGVTLLNTYTQKQSMYI